jgi:hypothetical protein
MEWKDGSAGSSPKEVGACIDDIILQSPWKRW